MVHQRSEAGVTVGEKAVCHNHNFGDNDSILAITARNLGLRRAPVGGERQNDIILSAFYSLNDRHGRQASLVSLVLVHGHRVMKRQGGGWQA